MTARRLSQPPSTPPACFSIRTLRGIDMDSSTVQGVLTLPDMLNSFVPWLRSRPKPANHGAPLLQMIWSLTGQGRNRDWEFSKFLQRCFIERIMHIHKCNYSSLAYLWSKHHQFLCWKLQFSSVWNTMSTIITQSLVQEPVSTTNNPNIAEITCISTVWLKVEFTAKLSKHTSPLSFLCLFLCVCMCPFSRICSTRTYWCNSDCIHMLAQISMTNNYNTAEITCTSIVWLKF